MHPVDPLGRIRFGFPFSFFSARACCLDGGREGSDWLCIYLLLMISFVFLDDYDEWGWSFIKFFYYYLCVFSYYWVQGLVYIY